MGRSKKYRPAATLVLVGPVLTLKGPVWQLHAHGVPVLESGDAVAPARYLAEHHYVPTADPAVFRHEPPRSPGRDKRPPSPCRMAAQLLRTAVQAAREHAGDAATLCHRFGCKRLAATTVAAVGDQVDRLSERLRQKLARILDRP